MFKFISYSVIILIILASIIYGSRIIKNPSTALIHPPINSEIIIIGDNLFFMRGFDELAKYSKDDLVELSALPYPGSMNPIYSSYLDKIIFHAQVSPSHIVVVDYQDMIITNDIEIMGRVTGIESSGNKLYITSDHSGISDGSDIMLSDLPHSTGRVAEMDLGDFSIDWEVNVGTIPTYIEDAGNYLIISSWEDSVDSEGYYCGLINIVDKSTLLVSNCYAGSSFQNYIEYDGLNKVYICNPETRSFGENTEEAGITVLDLTTLQTTNIIFPKPGDSGYYFGVLGSCLIGSDLYVTYSSLVNNTTYYGKYNTTAGLVENIELPGMDKQLMFISVDEGIAYFSTEDNWLIKYELP